MGRMETSNASSPPDKVLFALSQWERDFFMPGVSLSEISGIDSLVIDSSAMTPEEWSDCLKTVRPTILVSSWRTAPLPESYACPRTASGLRYICHVAGTVRRVVPRQFIADGGLVTNWGDTAAPMVAEHALLLALSALRNQPAWHPYLKQPAPKRGHALKGLQPRTLFGRSVGLHGFGRVARNLLAFLRPFNVRAYAYSEGVPDEFILKHGATPCHSLTQLFQQSEVLFECEALTPLSHRSVTASVLAELPDDAVFINVGRGATVDEEALYCEAAAGRIRLALDVAASEPITPGNRLLDLPGIILSPHIAGPTWDRLPACGELALQNIRAFLAGHPLEAVVTLEAYDRST